MPAVLKAPGEGLHDGLLKGSRGRRRRRVIMRNRLNVGRYVYVNFWLRKLWSEGGVEKSFDHTYDKRYEYDVWCI